MNSTEYDLKAIGGFQVDNIVMNRVPFILINLGVQLEDLFKSLYLVHAKNQVLVSSENPDKILTQKDEILKELETRHVPKEFPILVLCLTGEDSKKLSQTLESLGFTNTFYARDGLAGILESRHS